MNVPRSRIQEARRRAGAAKRTALALAAAGFLAVVLLARESHPAGSASPASGTSANAPASRAGDDFDFGSGSLSPSNATPHVQTSTS